MQKTAIKQARDNNRITLQCVYRYMFLFKPGGNLFDFQTNTKHAIQ